jgi:hypothetical protein
MDVSLLRIIHDHATGRWWPTLTGPTDPRPNLGQLAVPNAVLPVEVRFRHIGVIQDQIRIADFNVIVAQGETMRTPGRITGWATLAVLLVAYESPGSAQQMDNKMNDVADQLRTELAGEPVAVRQRGSVTLTSGADAGGLGAEARSAGAQQDCSHPFQASAHGDRGWRLH